MKTTSRLLALVLASTLAVTASAQSNYWSENNSNRGAIATHKAVARATYPTEFRLFNLDIAPLRTQLFSIVDNTARSTVIVLPNADGGLEQFEVYEASNFEPELQAQFPLIRA